QRHARDLLELLGELAPDHDLALGPQVLEQRLHGLEDPVGGFVQDDGAGWVEILQVLFFFQETKEMKTRRGESSSRPGGHRGARARDRHDAHPRAMRRRDEEGARVREAGSSGVAYESEGLSFRQFFYQVPGLSLLVVLMQRQNLRRDAMVG